MNRRWPIASMNRPSRPASDPARIRTRSSGGVGDDEVRQVEHEHRRVGHDRDLVAGQRGEDRLDRARQRPPDGAVEDEHRERRQPVEGRALAGLGREEVAPFLARQAGHDDPADAHRPGPGERLGIDPRADHQDRAGRSDVEPARSQLALGTGLEPPARRPTEGHDPADAATGRPDRDPDAGSDLAHDPGERRLERVGQVAQRDAPAVVPQEDVLATGPGLVAAPRWLDPAIAGARGDLRRVELLEARVAEALGDRRPDDDRIAGRHERPVAGCEGEHGVDRRHHESTCRHEADVRGGHASRPGHDRRLPRLEELTAQVGPVGQPQRHVAQVDHEAAEPARHVDREMPAARAEPDPVAELELGHRRTCRAAGRRGRGRRA